MGNLESLLKKTVEEYHRVLQLQPKNEEHQYLTLQDLLRIRAINVVKEYSIDLTHLGTLFILDRTKTGRFYEEEFVEFIKLCHARENSDTVRRSHSHGDFQAQLQAHCTWHMWNQMIKEEGEKKWVEWFSRLFSESEKVFGEKKRKKRRSQEVEDNGETPFLSRGTVQLLHKILNIKKAYGVSDRDFFDLCQRASEEKKWMNLQDENLDEYVPVEVVRHFAEEFVKGFINLMFELGFEKCSDESSSSSPTAAAAAAASSSSSAPSPSSSSSSSLSSSPVSSLSSLSSSASSALAS